MASDFNLSNSLQLYSLRSPPSGSWFVFRRGRSSFSSVLECNYCSIVLAASGGLFFLLLCLSFCFLIFNLQIKLFEDNIGTLFGQFMKTIYGERFNLSSNLGYFTCNTSCGVYKGNDNLPGLWKLLFRLQCLAWRQNLFSCKKAAWSLGLVFKNRLKGHCHGDFAVFWYKLLKYLTKNLFLGEGKWSCTLPPSPLPHWKAIFQKLQSRFRQLA